MLGPRCVGKTTALYQTVRHLLEVEVVSARIWWMRLDHPLLLQEAAIEYPCVRGPFAVDDLALNAVLFEDDDISGMTVSSVGNPSYVALA